MTDLARDNGFKVLVAMRGADALALAREFRPTAVSLDVFLPDMLGWTVLSQLKQDAATGTSLSRSSPSTKTASTAWPAAPMPFSTSRRPRRGWGGPCGALGRIKDYAQPRRKRLLVVEDNAASSSASASCSA